MSEQTTHTVYLLFAADETCLYIGCSMQGSARLHDHGKRAWWTDVAYGHFEHYDDRRTALDRERSLIHQLEPVHNQRHAAPRTERLNLVPSPDEKAGAA